MDDKQIAESSLILLRSAASNRMTREILKSTQAQHLAFSLQVGGVVVNDRRYGRAILKNVTPEEMNRIKIAQGISSFRCTTSGPDCFLDFSPEEGTEIAILSRVLNPHADSWVTILNTDSGRAVEQIARLLTDDKHSILTAFSASLLRRSRAKR